jgi:hypothetical protein
MNVCENRIGAEAGKIDVDGHTIAIDESRAVAAARAGNDRHLLSAVEYGGETLGVNRRRKRRQKNYERSRSSLHWTNLPPIKNADLAGPLTAYHSESIVGCKQFCRKTDGGREVPIGSPAGSARLVLNGTSSETMGDQAPSMPRLIGRLRWFDESQSGVRAAAFGTLHQSNE